MRYIIAPMDIKDDEFKVYKYLWSKCDFKTMVCEYTERNILIDIKADFSRKRLQNIFKTFIEMNLFVILEKGTKGNPSKLFINKEVLWNQIRTELEPNKNQINVENTIFEETKEPNKNQIGTTKVPSIKEVKNKDKEYIYSNEKEIFNYWNSKEGVIHSQEKSFDKNKISTAIKNLGKDEILKAIDRLNKVVLDSNYYYNFKWNIYKFLKQQNGISNWLEDGQLWNDYLQKNKTETKTQNKRGTNILDNSDIFN